MEKTVKKAIKTGFGLGLLTLREAKKIAAKVKKDLGLDKKESLKLAMELVVNSEKASKAVLGTARKHFETAIVKSGIAKKKEIAKVKKMLKKRVYGKLLKKEITKVKKVLKKKRKVKPLKKVRRKVKKRRKK